MTLKKAAFINACGKYSKVLLTLIVNAILARILSATDYGIVAIITVFSTFFTTFSDMGFGVAVIQNKKLSKYDIDNIFSFTIYMSIILMLIFAGCSKFIAEFYKNPVYVPLGILLSISLLFNSANMVPNGILNRNKKFVILAVRTTLVYFFSAIITIILAVVGLRYYALAIQAVLTAVFTFLWNIITTKPKFYFNFEFKSVKKVINYSGYQFAFNVVNYFARNLDNLLTGKFMGSAQLGYYDKAYNLMLYPVNNLTGVVSPVLHPILSDYQNNYELIYIKYMKVFKILFCIALYIAPLCYLASNEIVDIMYGNNWGDAASCFKYLSLAIIPQMLNSSTGGIFQAIGNTKLLFWNSCINTAITVIAILIGIFFGKSIIVLSICVAIAYIFHFFTAYYMLIVMGFHYKISKFIKDILPDIVILIGMFTAVILYPLGVNSNVLFEFMKKALYSLGFFIVFLLITKEYRVLNVFNFSLLKRTDEKLN